MCLWSSVSTTADSPGADEAYPRTVAPPGASTAHSAAPASTATHRQTRIAFILTGGAGPRPRPANRRPQSPSRILRAGADTTALPGSVGAELVRRGHAPPRCLGYSGPRIRHPSSPRGQRPSASRAIAQPFGLCEPIGSALAAEKAETAELIVARGPSPGQRRPVTWHDPVTNREGQCIAHALTAFLFSTTVHVNTSSVPSRAHP